MTAKKRGAKGKRGAESINGNDSNGISYDTVQQMWEHELAEKHEGGDTPVWYTKTVDYWKAADATIDGVLGGFGTVSDADLGETRQFLGDVAKHLSYSTQRCIDMGCGIGRVAVALLQQIFTKVDLLEPCEHLLSKAKADIQPKHLGETYLDSLQTFVPAEGRYDCIFIQWAILYLTDEDVVQTLKRCKAGLCENGFILVKENVTRDSTFHVDKVDNSIMRCDRQYRSLFRRSGLQLVHFQQQQNWPEDLYPVNMYALR
eukprot:RCo041464